MKLITLAIKKTHASDMSDFGKVMSTVMSKAQGRANGKIVNKLVKKTLNK